MKRIRVCLILLIFNTIVCFGRNNVVDTTKRNLVISYQPIVFANIYDENIDFRIFSINLENHLKNGSKSIDFQLGFSSRTDYNIDEREFNFQCESGLRLYIQKQKKTRKNANGSSYIKSKTNLFEGVYIRPAVGFIVRNRGDDSYSSDYFIPQINVNFGYKKVLQEYFVLNIYGGLQLAYDKYNYNEQLILAPKISIGLGYTY